MKTRLLSLAFLATIFACNTAKAQCTVSTPTISNIVQSGCTYTFDLSFNLKGNGGNKVTSVYIFNVSDYAALPSSFYGQNNNSVPTSAALNSAGALATIKINTDSALTVHNYQKVANKSESPSSMRPGLQYAVDAQGQVTVRNISISFANCNSLITVRADVLSSQSPELSSIGCLTKGLSFSPNEPILRTLNRGCGDIRAITATFITTQSRTSVFRIFRDVAPFGQFTAADTAAANVVSPWYSATTTIITSSDFRSVGSYDYSLNPGETANVWVVAYTAGIPNVSVSLATNSCAPLPTVFRAVTAQRLKQNVLVKWETATEENNQGFYIQRQIGSGAWQSLAFVPTQATGGNSAAMLSYAYTDVNTAQGISQYRVQQVGIDGKSSFSAIRSVRSEEMADKTTVYPNPSTTGNVTLSFESHNVLRDVVVSDVSGRIVRRFSAIKDNSVVIENLASGLYSVQVTNRNTNNVSIQKLVVQAK